MDTQDPDRPSDQPVPPRAEPPLLPLPPAKRRAWEKPLAIAGIALGFFPYIIPGFFALRSYTRWQEGKIGKPLFAWIWCAIIVPVLLLGGMVAYDEFRDQTILANDFNDGTGDWPADSDNFVTLEYVDGGYRFLINDPSQPHSSSAHFTDISVPGLSLEADVTERVGPTTVQEALGLWCLRSVDVGYLFAVQANGDYAIVKTPGASTGSGTVLTSGTNASAGWVLGQTKHLRIECWGGGEDPTAITGFVDDLEVAEVLDPEGYDSFSGIGLFLSTSERGTDVLWDNVLARRISSASEDHPSVTTSTPSGVATSAPEGLNGTWAGTTSQGKSITFTVTDDSVTSIAVRWRHGGDACPLLDSRFEASALEVPIVEGVFTIQDPSIVGTFGSDATASGTASFTTNKSGCKPASITWEAQK